MSRPISLPYWRSWLDRAALEWQVSGNALAALDGRNGVHRCRTARWDRNVGFRQERPLTRAAWPTLLSSKTMTASMWRSFISFRLERPIERKGDVMKKKDADTVRFQLDPDNLPPLTEAQQAELDALQACRIAGSTIATPRR